MPPTVLLHELGHAVMVWVFGERVVGFGFLGYLGWVEHRPLGPPEDAIIALAGNVVTLLLGAGALLYGLRRPGHAVRNTLAIELGRQSLFLVLVFYPAVCFMGFAGDFTRIYDFRATPVFSGIVAAAHVAILAVGWGWLWQRRWRPRAALLTSPFASKLAQLERRVAADDGDLLAHRELGLLLVDAGAGGLAAHHLARAIDGGRGDARTKLALGAVLVSTGDPEAAVPLLRGALEGLLRPEDRRRAEIPLARALIALGRDAEARPLVEALAARSPRDASIRALEEALPRLPPPPRA